MKNIVISLKSAGDRRNHITNEFQNHNVSFEFFDALTPDVAKSYAKNLSKNFEESDLTGGELACMMSHVSIWKKIIDESIPYLAVFEDDVYLGADAEYLLNTTNWIKPTWNIIKIEAFSKKVFLSSNYTKIAGCKRQITQLKGENLGTAGYIISKDAAQIYLNCIHNNVLLPLDEMMFDYFINHGNEPVYQMVPALCIQEMLLNKEAALLPSSLVKDRKNRMYLETTSVLYKLKRETSRIGTQARKAVFAKEVTFR